LTIFTIISNLCIAFSLEIAYFNPNTKDVIPGVSPQILQIKVQRRFHCILANFKKATVTNTSYQGSTLNVKSNKIINKLMLKWQVKLLYFFLVNKLTNFLSVRDVLFLSITRRNRIQIFSPNSFLSFLFAGH